MGWPFCTKGNSPHHPYLLSTLCELTFLHQHLLHPLCSLCPLHSLHPLCDHCVHCMGWPFCTKGNSPHHPHLLSTLCELTFLHQQLLHPLHGVDLFALKVMVPKTHICWVHCVNWPFCTNTYCVHCVGGWPFCTKGNGPHHSYLLSTLCELTFLQQHLLRALGDHCMGWPSCTKGNGPHHPYLLSTLCELTFLLQHLLHPLRGGWPFCTKGNVPHHSSA